MKANYNIISSLKLGLAIFFLFFSTAVVLAQDSDAMEDANIVLSFVDDASSHKIIAKATDKNGEPIADLDLYFYVKRTFSNLPFGDVFNTTDEDGTVAVDFPKDLPGDHEGNVTIFVKIKDSDLYNDQTIETVKNWGVPTALDSTTQKRTLWAAGANAPIPLVLIISSLIVSIWFIIFYIVHILVRISKIRSIKT
ncbi:MAG TPA: hypothetical protein VJ945_05050 [Flavobacteriaceae bacterium]|nr:hypothetical protein [Flavobacteriaceae bacterium]